MPEAKVSVFAVSGHKNARVAVLKAQGFPPRATRILHGTMKTLHGRRAATSELAVWSPDRGDPRVAPFLKFFRKFFSASKQPN